MRHRKGNSDVHTPGSAAPQPAVLKLLQAGTKGTAVEKANRIIVVNSLCLTSAVLAFSFSLLIFSVSGDYGVLIAGLAEAFLFSGFIWLNAKGKYPATAIAYLFIHNIALVYFAVLRGMILEEGQLMFFLFVCSLLILGPWQHIAVSLMASAGILIFAAANLANGWIPVTAMDPAAAGPFRHLGTIALSVLTVVAVGHFKWQDLKYNASLRNQNKALEAEVAVRTSELVWLNEKLEASNEQLFATNRKLDTANETLTTTNVKLATSNAALQQANANVRYFYNQFSHDTRDKLHAMLHMCLMLLRRAEGRDTEALEYAKHLHIAITALMSMGDDILAVKLIEQGLHNKIVTQTIRTRAWLQNLVKVTRYSAEIRKIQVFTDFDKNLPEFIVTDPVKLEKIIANLLANAIKNTRSMVILRAYASGKHLLMEVKDNGRGIPPEKQSRIFDKDFTTGGGTGLGLYIVDSLCSLMGVKLELDSILGKGTSFFLKVPFKTGNREDLPSVENMQRISETVKGKRILIADDEPTNLMLLRYYMQKAGCIVLEAKDGLELLDIAKRALPDLIIMDYKMPGLDGIEALQQLRATPGIAATPVMLMTATSSDEGEVLQADADDFQYKPVSPDKLLRSIAELLQGSIAD